MAKMNNITLPDGSTIAIPSWASEDTMSSIANYMAATNAVDKKFLTLVKNLGGDVGDLQKSISSLAVGVQQQTKNDSALDMGTALSKGMKGVAQKVQQASEFFGDAEKPMTSLVGATKTLTDGLKETNLGLLDKIAKPGSKLNKAFSQMGGVTDVAVDAGLAYLGWNAAKFEQFAEAQKKALDSGAIFYKSGETFDDLYQRSMDAGVHYGTMMDTINQFGGTMTALGGSVSMGTDNFVGMFDNLNTMADQFGDLGLSSADMLTQYAGFLEYARLSGQLGGATLDAGDKINNAFINLQIEATGLANLTAINKSEAIQRQLAAMSEPLMQLGTSTLREDGLVAQADMAETIAKQLGIIAPEAPMLQGLLDALGQELAETHDNISDFSIARRLDPQLRSALDTAMPGFLETINQLIRTGDQGQIDANTFIIRSLANIDQTKKASAGAVSGSALRIIQDLQGAGFQIDKNYGNYLKLSQEERDAYNANIGKAMDESGKTIETMNKATTQFLQLQDFMTLPMQGTATMFENVTTALESGAQQIKEFFGIEDDGFGEIEESGSMLDDTVINPIRTNPTQSSSPTNVTVPETSEVFNPNDTNFTEQDFSFTANASKTANALNSMSPAVRERFASTIKAFNEQYGGEGYKVLISEGFRSNERSNQLRASGVKAASGGRSWHNYGMAGDILIYKDGKLVNDDRHGDYTSKLGDIARSYGLNNPVSNDSGHFQPSEMPVAVPNSLFNKAKESGFNANAMISLANNLSVTNLAKTPVAKLAQAEQAITDYKDNYTGNKNSRGYRNELKRLEEARDKLAQSKQQAMEVLDKVTNSNVPTNPVTPNVELSSLTPGSSNATISDLDSELASVIAYKEQALNSANALAETLNIASGNKKRSEQVNIINAA